MGSGWRKNGRLIAAALALLATSANLVALDFLIGKSPPIGHNPEHAFLAFGDSLNDPLADSVNAMLGERNSVDQLNTNITATSKGKVYRVTAVSVLRVESTDPAAATLLNGSLAATNLTDELFGQIMYSSPDAEETKVSNLSPTFLTAERTQVWNFPDSGIFDLNWMSPNYLQSFSRSPSALHDSILIGVHLVGAHMFGLNGISSADVETSLSTSNETTITINASKIKEITVGVYSNALSDSGISGDASSCNNGPALWDCFNTSIYDSSGTATAYPNTGYLPNEAVKVLEALLVFLVAVPLVVVAGRRRVITKLWSGWSPFAYGGAVTIAAIFSSYLVGVFAFQSAWSLAPSTTFLWLAGYGLTIVLFMQTGTIAHVRRAIAIISVSALGFNIGYLCATRKIGAEIYVILTASLIVTFGCAILMKAGRLTALVAVAVVVSLDLQYNVISGSMSTYEPGWMFPHAIKEVEPAWLPTCVALVAVATIETYLLGAGKRTRKLFLLLYPAAVLLAVVPDAIIWPQRSYAADQGLSEAVAPKLPWMAAITVFVVCGLVRLFLYGRNTRSYENPAARHLAAGIVAYWCMLLVYPSYSGGLIASTATVMTLTALRSNKVSTTSHRFTSKRAHANAVGRYHRARSLLAARAELHRGGVAKLAAGEMSIQDFSQRSESLRQAINDSGGTDVEVREKVFGLLVDETPVRAGIVAALFAGLISVPIVIFDVSGIPETFFQSLASTLPLIVLWQAISLERWLAYGFIFGFFYPTLRGTTSAGKAILFGICVVPIEVVLTWMAVPAQSGKGISLELAVAQTMAFFLILGMVWEIRLIRRAGVAWGDLRILRGARAVLAPAGAVAVAVLTAAVTAFTTTEAPRLVPPPQPSPSQTSHTPGSSNAGQTPAAPDSQVAWPTGAETVLPTSSPDCLAPAASPRAPATSAVDACSSASVGQGSR